MPSDPQTADTRKDGGPELVRLGDRFEILPGQPVPALDGVAGPAFMARAVRGRKAECFALICSGAVPPRSDALSTLLSIDNPGIVRLIDFGLVDWNQGKNRRQALILERPLGRRLMTSLKAPAEPMSEDQILRVVIPSMAAVLRDLSGRTITHGGIRPTNLFLRDGGTGVVLGECVSAPPGYAQPLLFEPVERAMATSGGRGNGSILDDIYAFGMTLVVLALGRNPALELSDDALIDARIDRGSFAAVVGNIRLPQNLTEPVRGMLLDDPKQRWGINQLDLWLSGRRLSPKQGQLPKRAVRPLEVSGQEAWHCRGLARLMAANVPAAAGLIDGGDLDRWLRRGLSDDALAETVAAAADQAAASASRASSMVDRVVARVAIALDPHAPIRYKAKAVMPDSIGVALADAFLRREGTQPLAEIIAWQLPTFWVNVQPEVRAEVVPLVQAIEGLRSLLERTGPGFGIERVLYEANPHLSCLSPIVADFAAATPPDLLTALELASAQKERAREPLDRHLAAFLAARHRRLEDAMLLQFLPGVDPVRRVTALISILGDIQVRYAVDPLPGLCKWLGTMMDPTFARFYNRKNREAVRKHVEKVASEGKLVDLLRAIDDPDAIRRDAQGFAAARRDVKRAATEADALKDKIANPDLITEGIGRQVAAVVSWVLALALAGLLSMLIMFGGS
ncbi:MAG: serine/threonine protein kinase [Rhodospirillaceae bacterium]